MPFFRRAKKTSQAPVSPEMHLIVEQVMERRAKEIIYSLRKYRSREFEALLSDIENGYIERARLTLRGLDGVEEAYIEPVLQQLQAEVADVRVSALEEHPDAFRLLLRSGNRHEAIELYQKRTGGDWQIALDAIKEMERKLAEEDAKKTGKGDN